MEPFEKNARVISSKESQSRTVIKYRSNNFYFQIELLIYVLDFSTRCFDCLPLRKFWFTLTLARILSYVKQAPHSGLKCFLKGKHLRNNETYLPSYNFRYGAYKSMLVNWDGNLITGNTILLVSCKYLCFGNMKHLHCVKNVHIRGYSDPYFPSFGLNTWR